MNEYNFVHKIYQETKKNCLKSDLFQCLSCTKETWLLNKYLNEHIDNNTILAAIKNVASKSYGNILALDFVRNNMNELIKKYFFAS